MGVDHVEEFMKASIVECQTCDGSDATLAQRLPGAERIFGMANEGDTLAMDNPVNVQKNTFT